MAPGPLTPSVVSQHIDIGGKVGVSEDRAAGRLCWAGSPREVTARCPNPGSWRVSVFLVRRPTQPGPQQTPPTGAASSSVEAPPKLS